MTLSKELEETLKRAFEQAKVRRHEFITLEQLHRGVEVFERLFRNTCCRPDH